MREILFRGKMADGKWVYGNLIEHYDIFDRYIKYYCIESFTGEDRNQVDSDTVGQFTGLLDKNGNKIFEGDIVEYTFANSNVQYEVSFKDGMFVANRLNCTIPSNTPLTELPLSIIEVTGNVFERGE